MAASITTLVIIIIFSTSVMSLGVTRPVPYDVQLMHGESAGFTFEIQAVTSSDDIACTYSINGLDPLVIEFNEEETVVNAGSIRNVYGTVTVPEGAEFNNYEGTLSVSCGAVDTEGVGGSAVKTTIGGSKFFVDVVDVRERDIRPISPPEPEGMDATTIILIIVAIIIVIAVIYYLVRKFRKR